MKLETLSGEFIRLEPLSLDRHFRDLCEVGLDADLWRWTTACISTASDMRKYLETVCEEQHRSISLPFAIIDKQSNKAIGSSRFANISAEHRRVEIGWTWIGEKWQRTSVNTETKFLMLQHAFEIWKCQRVELKTDLLNTRSRAAIARLGAVEEGVLRKHQITELGRARDTVYFSIINNEWPQVKGNLKNKLQERTNS